MSDERERDDALNQLLRRWRTPAVFPALDDRVMAAFRGESPRRWYGRWSLWVPVAVTALASLLFVVERTRPARGVELDSVLETASAGTNYVTRVNASGFVPVPDGKIVMSKVENTQ